MQANTTTVDFTKPCRLMVIENGHCSSNGTSDADRNIVKLVHSGEDDYSPIEAHLASGTTGFLTEEGTFSTYDAIRSSQDSAMPDELLEIVGIANIQVEAVNVDDDDAVPAPELVGEFFNAPQTAEAAAG